MKHIDDQYYLKIVANFRLAIAELQNAFRNSHLLPKAVGNGIWGSKENLENCLQEIIKCWFEDSEATASFLNGVLIVDKRKRDERNI